jgi:hypothetical protein
MHVRDSANKKLPLTNANHNWQERSCIKYLRNCYSLLEMVFK